MIWFENHTIASKQRGNCVTERQSQGVVPGRNHAHHTFGYIALFTRGEQGKRSLALAGG